jgi:hypothetical protein
LATSLKTEETMRRIIAAFSALALSAISGYAQVATPGPGAPCALTEASAPQVRGVRLGMALDQVVALFPGSTRRKEIKEGIDDAKAARGDETITLVFDPSVDGAAGSSADVSGIAVGFTRSRVTDFLIIYVGPAWGSVDEWVSKLAEAFKLPAGNAWTTGNSETPNKVLRCKEVEIEAQVQGGGATVRVRRAAAMVHSGHAGAGAQDDAARRRRDFKP